MFYVYVIESITANELYVGFTTDIKKRLNEHNNGQNTSTKRYVPWNLIYYEACLNDEDAKRREKYLKTSQGRRMLKARIKEYLYDKKYSA